MEDAKKGFSKGEFRKAAARALKKVEKLIKDEPSIVIETGEPNNESASRINETTKWLFHRRQDDGNKGS